MTISNAMNKVSSNKQDAMLAFTLGHLIPQEASGAHASITALIESVRSIAISGDSERLHVVEAALIQARQILNFNEQDQIAVLYLEAAICFDSLGRFKEAIELVELALTIAESVDRDWLKRKAHNVAAVSRMRSCDLVSAIYHLEKSLDIAVRTEDDIGRFAALSNAVSLLDAMDATTDAIELSLRLLKFEGNDIVISELLFQSAINGGQLSIAASDVTSLQKFVVEGDKKLRKTGLMPDVWLAQHAANKVILTAWVGAPAQALTRVERLIGEKRECRNLQIDSILLWAKAIACASLSDENRSAKTRIQIRRQLKLLYGSSFYYVELLRTLILLYERTDNRRKERVQSGLRRRLQHYHVVVKHADFFAQLGVGGGFGKSKWSLDDPCYELPEIISRSVGGSAGRKGVEETLRASGRDGTFAEKVARRPRASRPDVLRTSVAGQDIQVSYMTRPYKIAENWAIAADYAAEMADGSCFKIAYLAAAIARTLGWSEDCCEKLELACRLCNIGLIAVDRQILRDVSAGRLDADCIVSDHAWAGHALLAKTEDSVLELGSTVALSHHEWWNGCGFPQGLRGDGIPLEGRICAIAHEYYVQASYFKSETAESRRKVLAQCSSMGGIQLDPQLIMLLPRALDSLNVCVDKPRFSKQDNLFTARLRFTESVLDALS